MTDTVQGSQERSDEFGEVLGQLFGGRTVLANWNPPSSSDSSINDENLPTILDCGCGRGAWISSFLEEHGSDFLVSPLFRSAGSARVIPDRWSFRRS